MSDGGKGDTPRPLSVSIPEFDQRWDAIFGKTKPTDTPCSKDPRAPHGFDRNGSHSAGRYVCECESWTPDTIQQELVADHIKVIREALINALEAFDECKEYPITNDLCHEALIRLHALRVTLGVPSNE